jgi:hypothetical protein
VLLQLAGHSRAGGIQLLILLPEKKKELDSRLRGNDGKRK